MVIIWRFLAVVLLAGMAQPLGAGEFDPAEILEPPVAAPELALRDEDGDLVKLSALRGSYVLLNFWATWCAPCIEEMPGLDRLQADLGDGNFHVVAASIEGNRQLKRIELFYQKNRLRHLSAYALDNPPEKRKFGVEGVPTTILIDPEGRQLWRVVGPVDWDSAPARKLVKLFMKSGE